MSSGYSDPGEMAMLQAPGGIESAIVTQIAAQIRAAGARATPARIRVLQLLRTASHALTHHDLETALGEPAMDRVTLYRVLDWLVEAGLAHKLTDANRVFRFAVAKPGDAAMHAHFRCERCARVFCLSDAAPQAPELPQGFSLSRMEVDLHGCCPDCSPTRVELP